jgi:UPF0755 protein
MRRALIILAIIAILGGMIYGGSVALFAVSAYRPGSVLSSNVLVRKGQTPHEIARLLQGEGAIGDVEQFVRIGRWMRKWGRIKAGEYKVSPGMSPLELFSVITSGISVVHPVTVREGENMYEVAADLASKKLATVEDFLTLCRDPEFIGTLGLNIPSGKYESLEGYLFPDTYNFNVSMKPEEMIHQMTKRFATEWDSGLAARAQQLGYSRHQVVILASIIEKETGAMKERDLISSVFHNRLKKHMKLQSDPTTIYGIWDHYHGKIHSSDLQTATPYNTYTVPALPAGPISNPGKNALNAALFPAKSDYLYFVSHNDGTSEFSATLDAHNRAVQKFQLDPRARAGKSWRDLNKHKN